MLGISSSTVSDGGKGAGIPIMKLEDNCIRDFDLIVDFCS